MSQDQDEKLDKMLHSRRIEPSSQDLATRIILKAQSLPQVQNLSLWQAVRQLFAEFHLPQPGYVLATALVLGMMLGFSTAPDDDQSGNPSSMAAQSYIAGDEELL
jgi:hypothetical protein